ncbi:MAG: hypothetical protein WC446_07225, partial [Candidatus Paceibacterota bacterium]
FQCVESSFLTFFGTKNFPVHGTKKLKKGLQTFHSSLFQCISLRLHSYFFSFFTFFPPAEKK